MLKRYFISLLGALTAIWVSFMLIIVLGMTFAIGSIVSSFGNSNVKRSIEKGSVLTLDLSGVINENNATPDIYAILNNQPLPMSLCDITNAIFAAANDKKIEGIYIKCCGSSAGIATREAIRNALSEFSKSGKWIIAYGNSYTQGDYYIASIANEIYLNPVGEIDLRGLASGVPFFKGLLDKVGVEMQVVKVGTFKSAVEPYILTHMSEPNRLQTHVYLDNIWNRICSEISESRGITIEELNQIADNMGALMPAEEMVDHKLVDGLKYIDEFEAYLKDKLGIEKDLEIQSIDIQEYLATEPEIPNTKKSKNKIAVYYACGDITESGKDGIASDRIVPDVLDLAEDDDIDALVLRVNSGGGSAFASEQIWHALEVFKDKGKTLYVSMGDYAASGGYYISCGAKKIYAEPMTLTGSIGIFGMIPCAKTLLNDKLGVNIDFVETNLNAAGPNIVEPMDTFQRSRMQSMVERGYDLFTKRCADGRHMPQDSIKAIAEGRVWDGMTALKIGLVDELGSLSNAIDDLAKEMGYGKYEIAVYPTGEKDFFAMLMQLNNQMKTNTLKEELGIYYPAYNHLKSIQDLDPIQARMEILLMD